MKRMHCEEEEEESWSKKNWWGKGQGIPGCPHQSADHVTLFGGYWPRLSGSIPTLLSLSNFNWSLFPWFFSAIQSFAALGKCVKYSASHKSLNRSTLTEGEQEHDRQYTRGKTELQDKRENLTRMQNCNNNKTTQKGRDLEIIKV